MSTDDVRKMMLTNAKIHEVVLTETGLVHDLFQLLLSDAVGDIAEHYLGLS